MTNGHRNSYFRSIARMLLGHGVSGKVGHGFIRTALVMLVWLQLLVVPAHAGYNTWQHSPATPGDWLTPTNWSWGLPGINLEALIDNGGTAELRGDAQASYLEIGYLASGAMTHFTGSLTLNQLRMGVAAGSSGSYELRDGSLSTTVDSSVGEKGTGYFLQTGGVHSSAWLYVGMNKGSSGDYVFNDGQLNLQYSSIGLNGSGSFTQTGGIQNITNYIRVGGTTGANGGQGLFSLKGGILNTHEIDLDSSKGTATFRQSGGTAAVAYSLYMGGGASGTGTFELSGSGSLTVGRSIPSWIWCDGEYVGDSGAATITQSGGMNTASWLYLGWRTGSSGTYSLSGGQLTAGVEWVGNHNTKYAGYDGVGLFTQTGGTNTAGQIYVYSGSRYQLQGGSMCFDGLNVDGELDLCNTTASIAASNAIIDFSRGSLSNVSHASLAVTGTSLTIVSPTQDLNALFGTYNNAGLVHVAGTPIVVSSGQTVSGQGHIYDHLSCAGNFSATPGGFIEMHGGTTISGNGCVDLGWGELLVSDKQSGISGGKLSGLYLSVGDSADGEFVQQGGQVVFGRIQASGHSGGIAIGGNGHSGSYYLNGGSMSANWLRINGLLSQGGGTVVADGISVGSGGAGIDGTYEMNGGTVTGAGSMMIRAADVTSGTLRGRGSVLLTGRLTNNGRVEANGLGTDGDLSLPNFAQVDNTIENPTAGGTHGWYASNHGRLVLPRVAVTSGSHTYNWGESPFVTGGGGPIQPGAGDTYIDLVNSVQVAFKNTSANGNLVISLLATDHGEAPEIPEGWQIIGLWQADANGFTFDKARLTFRYDDALADSLRIDQNDLRVFQVEGGTWTDVTDRVDTPGKWIFSTDVDSFCDFAVGVPEPASLGLLALGGMGMLARRRRTHQR